MYNPCLTGLQPTKWDKPTFQATFCNWFVHPFFWPSLGKEGYHPKRCPKLHLSKLAWNRKNPSNSNGTIVSNALGLAAPMLVCRDLQGASPSGSRFQRPACARAASCQLQFLGLQMAGSSSKLAQCSAEIMETDATKNCFETINCQTKP